MRTREILKNLLIVVLLFGMAFLSVSVWTANDPRDGLFGFLSGSDTVEESFVAPTVHTSPLGVSVKNANGRYSAEYNDAAVGIVYGQTSELLRLAVTTAKTEQGSNESVWLDAICSSPSVLYDYRYEIPMSVLSFWLGSWNPELFDGYDVRYLCLSVKQDTVYLHGKSRDGKDYFCYTTEISAEELAKAAEMSTPNAIALSAESGRVEIPELLLSGSVPQVYTMRAENTADKLKGEDLNSLLKSLKFNPNTISQHVEQDGTLIFVEDISTLKIAPNGMLTYSDLRTDLAYDTGISVAAENGESTVWEKAEAARELVEMLDGYSGSVGRMYPCRIRQEQGVYEILFCRVIDGIPVGLAENDFSARVRIAANRVTEIEFMMRNYQATTTPCVLLPSKLAAATLSDGAKSLELRYVDSGQETVVADWYVR